MNVQQLWPVGVVGGVAMALAALVIVVRAPDDGDAAASDRAEGLAGVIFGGVEIVGGGGLGGASVVVTAVDTGAHVATATSDPLGLFEVDIGDHQGPVVVTATKDDLAAATVVALGVDGAASGVRLVAGPAGGGSIEGAVLADGIPAPGPGVVEAKFVESGRTAVAAVTAAGTYRIDGLPLDGNLIVVATLGAGLGQGLTASVVSDGFAANYADIAVTTTATANQIDNPAIVTDDLDGWSVDGPATPIPP